MADPRKLTTEELETAVSGSMLRHTAKLSKETLRFLEIYATENGPITADIVAAWKRDVEQACVPRDAKKFTEELIARRGES